MKKINLINFFKFISRNKQNDNFKFLYLIILFLFVLFLFYFYSLEPDVNARDFLPKETSFYYEWTSIDKNISFDIFDNTIPNKNRKEIIDIIGSKAKEIENIIWFKIEEKDNFLIKFSKKIKKSFLEELVLNNSEYFFEIKQDYILYITRHKEFLNILPNYLVEDFIINNQKKGINIYWKNNIPIFLKQLVVWINPLLNNKKEEGVFINLYSNSINLFVKIENKKEGINLSSVKIINDFDSLSLIKNIDKDKNILNNFLTSLYNSLPHSILSLKNIFQDIILLQKNNNYLLISKLDWKLVIDSLIQNIKVIDVENILPDGTKYIELKQVTENSFSKYKYLDTEYWQIENFFGLSLDKFYYLSNSKDIIKELIKSNTNINDIIYTCLEESNNKINNLLYLKVSKIDNKLIKSYLENNNLSVINLIHYNNNVVEGWKLCF